jgi:hypothetical protein
MAVCLPDTLVKGAVLNLIITFVSGDRIKHRWPIRSSTSHYLRTENQYCVLQSTLENKYKIYLELLGPLFVRQNVPLC